MSMPPADAWDIAERTDPKDIDAAFVAHYSESSGRYFDELSESLTTSKFLAQWRPLLDECVQAYGQALYRVTVPCLFSVLEGAVVALGGKGKIIDRCHAHRDAAPKDRAARMIWDSLTPFVEAVFQDGRSASGSVINRNLVLHGHSLPQDWTIADSLRLFCALHALAVIVD